MLFAQPLWVAPLNGTEYWWNVHFKRFQKEFSNLPGFTQPESMWISTFILELQSQTWPPASLLLSAITTVNRR